MQEGMVINRWSMQEGMVMNGRSVSIMIYGEGCKEHASYAMYEEMKMEGMSM